MSFRERSLFLVFLLMLILPALVVLRPRLQNREELVRETYRSLGTQLGTMQQLIHNSGEDPRELARIRASWEVFSSAQGEDYLALGRELREVALSLDLGVVQCQLGQDPPFWDIRLQGAISSLLHFWALASPRLGAYETSVTLLSTEGLQGEGTWRIRNEKK